MLLDPHSSSLRDARWAVDILILQENAKAS